MSTNRTQKDKIVGILLSVSKTLFFSSASPIKFFWVPHRLAEIIGMLVFKPTFKQKDEFAMIWELSPKSLQIRVSTDTVLSLLLRY